MLVAKRLKCVDLLNFRKWVQVGKSEKIDNFHLQFCILSLCGLYCRLYSLVGADMVTVFVAIRIKDYVRRKMSTGCLLALTCTDKPWCSGHQDSCSAAVVCCTSPTFCLLRVGIC